MNSALIRQINTARVFHALREHPDTPQRSLTALTRLDAATVSTIVGRLETEGLIRRASRKSAGRAGRPHSVLRVNPDGGLLIGAGIDVTTIHLIAAGPDGAPRARLSVPGSRRADAALQRLQHGVERLLAMCGADMDAVRAVGITVPALLDQAGRLVLAPNLKWRDRALPARLRAAFPVPVRVDNVPKAAALAELLFGVARGEADFALVHGQSGIGGGLFLRGALYAGASGLGGEIGHMKVVPGGRPCGCGGRGCLEAYLAEAAIRARLAEAGVVLPDLPAVLRAADAGDAAVLAVLHELGRHLGLALANLINLISPRLVVLGGDLAVLAPHLLAAARPVMAASTLSVLRRHTRVVASRMGEDDAAMGGVALALDGLLPLPPPAPAAPLSRAAPAAPAPRGRAGLGVAAGVAPT